MGSGGICVCPGLVPKVLGTLLYSMSWFGPNFIGFIESNTKSDTRTLDPSRQALSLSPCVGALALRIRMESNRRWWTRT